MSYAKSNSRVVFDNYTTQLLSVAKTTNRIPLGVLSYAHKNVIYQSLIVLLSSAIEEYHKTFLEDWFFKLRTSRVTMDKIPVNSRMFGFLTATEHHYKSFLYNREGEKDIIKSLVKQKGLLKKYIDDVEVFDLSKFEVAILNKKKYPSTKNVEILYNRLGIPSIFNALSMMGHRDYKTQLDSFLSIRESIAHVGAGAVTFTDVKNQIAFLQEFIYLLDKELYKHCCRVAGAVYWPK